MLSGYRIDEISINFLYLKSKDGEIMNETYEKRIEKAKLAIQDAEKYINRRRSRFVSCCWYRVCGKRFTENFAPFIKRYGLTDMYTSGFYPFPTQEERWAYWAKHILVNRYEPSGTEAL